MRPQREPSGLTKTLYSIENMGLPKRGGFDSLPTRKTRRIALEFDLKNARSR